MKLSMRFIVILLASIICALLLIGVLKLYPVEISIPKDKEVLVRYYACSLALCTHGCDSDVVDKICLYGEDPSQECIEDPNSAYKSCQDFCDDWGVTGNLCGTDYVLSVPLQKEAYLKGCTKFYMFSSGGEEEIIYTTYHYETEIEKIVKKLNENGFPSLVGRSGSEILSSNCLTKGLFNFAPGFLYEKSEAIGDYKGLGSIIMEVMEDENVYMIFGCVPKLGQCQGFSSCKFHGQLKIWSNKKGSTDCVDVKATTSIVIPSSFDINVERSEGKEECGGVYKGDEKCERINIGDTAEFDVTITHDYDTSLPFTLAIESYSPNDDQDLGCDPPCSLKFNPNPIIVDSGIPGTSKLTFDDIKQEAETYTIRIIANKPDGYDTQPDIVTLKVVNIEVSLSPEEKPVVVQPGIEGTFTLKIVNHIDEDIEFTLSYVGPEACTCTDWEDDPIGTNTLAVAAGTSEPGTIKCSSDEVGEHKIAITATGGGFDKKSNYATLKVTECDASGIRLSISPNPVKSGETVTLTASGLDGCIGEEVIFTAYQNDLGFKIDFCPITEALGRGCNKELTANTPGTYDIYAIIEGIASTETPKTLTIEVDSPKVIGYTDKPGKPCTFDYQPGWRCGVWALGICDYCNVITPSNCACPRCCDPQTCKGLTPSNLCCICGSGSYSNGPPGASCLSPDTKTKKELTKNIWYWDVKFPRDLLVSDNIYATWSITWGNRFSTIIGNDLCDEKSDCDGGNGAPDELDTAECSIVNRKCRLTKGFDDKKYRGWEFIRISHDSRPVYGLQIEGWPDLRTPNNPCTGSDEDCEYYITQYECEDITGEFHPEYGCTWDGYDVNIDSQMDVYLHEKSGEWIHVQTLKFEDFGTKNKFYIRPPVEQRVWTNIDAILLTNIGSDEVEVDYVGLLTKGEDIPYCTDGDYECTGTPHQCIHWYDKPNECTKAGCKVDSQYICPGELHDCYWVDFCVDDDDGPKPCDITNFPTKTECEKYCQNNGHEWEYMTSDYYRIVDNGEKCYWGLECPKTRSSGWVDWKETPGKWGESSGVGPFGECKCDSDLGHCDEGYCITSLSLTDGRFLCYYNVVCANGGWRNPSDGQPHLAMQVCNPEQVCDPYNGCV